MINDMNGWNEGGGGWGKKRGFGGRGGGVGGQGERRTPIFTIREKYSKYTKHYVIILFVE